MLLCAASMGQAANSPSCTLRQLASVELSVADDVLVPVDYQGQKFRMVLNLGEAFGLLAPSAPGVLRLQAEKLAGSRPDDFKLSIGGSPVTASATVSPLYIGSYRIPRRQFFIDPREHSARAPPGEPVIGSLGMGELWPIDFELDLPHHRLSLYAPEHCPGAAAVRWPEYRSRIPMELNELGNVYFPLELDGAKIEATLSTASRDTYMHLDVSRQVFGFDEHSPGVQVSVDADGRAHDYFRAMTLTSGDLSLSDVDVHLVPPARSCTLSKVGMFGDVAEFKGRDDHLCYAVYPLVLGRRTIEHLRLYFATREKLIYFTKVGAGE
jgi:hypothetical protein